MRRVHWYHLVLMVLLVPRVSSAIQLRWSSGSTDLSFAEAARCTLVVQADSAEAVLPGEWQLLWLADSSGVNFLAPDSLAACLADTAEVTAIDPPSSSADSAAHQITAHFCSAGEASATTADFLIDQPGGSTGRFKVVALDPNDPDSTQVIESNEVTYNGGIDGEYPPLVLHASSVHQSLQLRVTAVGAGLSAANSMSIVALDSSWTLPLTITARSDASLTGVASVAALLPACKASVGSETGSVSGASLAADEEPATFDPQSGGCSAQFFEELLIPPPDQHGYTIQPKDFAFTRGFVDSSSNRFALHLFYIRHNYWYSSAQNDLNEKNIGHAWTTNFNSWHPNPTDTTALTVRAGKFDELHVWAPTIVQRGPTFWMFYTGVRNESNRRNQRIGVATSTDLNTWNPSDDPVLTSRHPMGQEGPGGIRRPATPRSIRDGRSGPSGAVAHVLRCS